MEKGSYFRDPAKKVYMNRNSSIKELLAHIRERPATYLGSPSVPKLKAFLDGYYLARWEMKEGHDNFGTMNEFQDMVQERFSIVQTFGWDRILEFFAGGGEREGFDLFWKLWDEHVSNQEENPDSEKGNSDDCNS